MQDFFDEELVRALEARRPRTRRDCENSLRPCPFVGCRHHLYLEVVNGRVKLNVPDTAVWEMRESCSLDLAGQGEMRLAAIGERLGLTRERIRQIEAAAIVAAQDIGRAT